MLTNAELFQIFKQNYPDLKANDYRPYQDTYLPKDKQAITIWLENGDQIVYFPKVDDEVSKEEEPVKKPLPTKFYIPEAIGVAFFHGEEWFECPHCHEQFEVYDAEYERYGYKKTHEDDDRVFICAKCGKKFRIT